LSRISQFWNFRWRTPGRAADPFLLHDALVAGFTDEAGGFADAGLFYLAEGNLYLLPAPDPLLKTLTFGALIVASGTLAALPFRRYQAIPDASSAPAQVTGPMQGVLESTPQATTFSSQGESNSATVQLAAGGDMKPTPSTYPNPTYRSANSWRQHSLERPRRRAEIPLTYEDLEVQIDLPDPIKERFNATVPIRALRLDQERMADLVMPAMESLATNQIEQIQKAAAKFAQGTRKSPSVTSSLASSREQSLDQLPKADPSNQTRHWIRQPD